MSKVVLIPSVPSNNVQEATSLSALEGMACGKVTIATNIGGLKEIIKEDYNGYLSKPRDLEEMSEKIIKALKLNSKNYNYIVSNARKEIVKNHGYINHCKEFLQVYDSCVN